MVDINIQLAEQQLLGFKHGKLGYGLIDLISSMGLTAKEWGDLKDEFQLLYLSGADIHEIDEYFEEKGGLK